MDKIDFQQLLADKQPKSMKDTITAVNTILSEDGKPTLTPSQEARLRSMIERQYNKLQRQGRKLTPVLLYQVVADFVQAELVEIEPDEQSTQTDDEEIAKPTSDVFQELDDLKIDYQGVDLQLKPKREKYLKWSNIIRYNAKTHFKDRYKRAYHYFQRKLRSEDPSDAELTKLAQSAVYHTLTPTQIQDYVQRIKYANQERTDVYPEASADPYILRPADLKTYGASDIWEARKSLFSGDFVDRPFISEEIQAQLAGIIKTLQKAEDALKDLRPTVKMSELDAIYQAVKQVKTDLGNFGTEERVEPDSAEDIGEDLQDDWHTMTPDEYQRLRDDLVDKYRREHPLLLKTKPESQRGQARADYNREMNDWVMEQMRKHHLPYALKKEYSRWYPAFTAHLQEHYPHRYKAVSELDEDGNRHGLVGFKDSQAIRAATLQAFNQRQLDEWQARVIHDTQLAGLADRLPPASSGSLKKSPRFDPEVRRKRLRQFVQYKSEMANDKPDTSRKTARPGPSIYKRPADPDLSDASSASSLEEDDHDDSSSVSSLQEDEEL